MNKALFSIASTDNLGQLSNGQLVFYISEYRRLLHMFERYTTPAARDLKHQLATTMETLEHEYQRRRVQEHLEAPA